MNLLTVIEGVFGGGFPTLIIALFALFAVLLLILFLQKRTFPVIRLLIIRIFRGRYSFEYLEFFKKNDLRNPLNTCIRDEITLHFSVFYKLLKNAAHFETQVPIEFKEVPFLTTYRMVVRQFGTPHCINIARFDHSRVKVVGYQESFQGKKMKSLFYFIENVFIMGEFVFSESRRMDPAPVKEALSKKYHLSTEVAEDTFYIRGPQGSMVNFHDNGFFASVKYLYRGDDHFNRIVDEIFIHTHQNGRAFKNAMIQEELLNRF